jgi:jumonji domain-containing protein 2
MQTQHIPGVTQPYLYVGVWRSLFGWHKEDVDLYSINYLHQGHPKFWYSIDLDSNKDFEALANGYFSDLHKECPEFLRHKTTLIEPGILLQNGVKMHKLAQKQGEFVISRAKAYHSGFNSGFNIAEAVNFALPAWI